MKVVNCPCGARIEGESDDLLIAGVKAHFVAAHPEMAGKYTDEQILSRASDE